MSRYIDADALIAEYDRVHIGSAGGARKLMVDAPTADVVEVRHGEWKYVGGDLGYSDLECSECGATTVFFDDERFNYCPNCGAKMKGE